MGQRARTPRDGRARMRMLEAQRAEAKALRQVEGAMTARDRAQQKLTAVLAVEQRRVDVAESAVATAQAALVDVSGFERAAQLLDVPVRSLRTTVKQAPRIRDSSQTDSAGRDGADQTCTATTVGQS